MSWGSLSDKKKFYGQASYTDWLHFKKCPNVI